MTANEFRKMALGFSGAFEAAHMDHPDFRIEGKIFASLGAPDEHWGMVSLTPEEQAEFVATEPEVFKPCNGAWGRRGATNVYLKSARKKTMQSALDAAFRNVKAKLAKKPARTRR